VNPYKPLSAQTGSGFCALTLAFSRTVLTVPPKVIGVVAVLPAPVAQDYEGAGAMAHDYIEIKGRAAVSSVALTRNEWIKAQRFGADYRLYMWWSTAKRSHGSTCCRTWLRCSSPKRNWR
jgi:hypothetical protein